jgi:hypothetical protein
MSSEGVLLSAEMLHAVLVLVLQVMTDPDVPGPSDPYLREHLHWYA